MSEVTIVYAHPYEKSFNHAILERVKELLDKQNKAYTVLDLYADAFNPVYSKEELKHFAEGKALDPLIKEYQEKLKDARFLILIFPIWWNDVPAILKGFFDKVMLNEFAYVETEKGLKGKLTNIKNAKIITTSEAPTWYLRTLGGNAVKRVLIKATLKDIGIQKGEWTNWGQISRTSDEERGQFLSALRV